MRPIGPELRPECLNLPAARSPYAHLVVSESAKQELPGPHLCCLVWLLAHVLNLIMLYSIAGVGWIWRGSFHETHAYKKTVNLLHALQAIWKMPPEFHLRLIHALCNDVINCYNMKAEISSR